jgi:tol-pal system protein YbgF
MWTAAVCNTGIATLLTRPYPVNASILTWCCRSRPAPAVAAALFLLGASALSASAQQNDAPQQTSAAQAAAPAGDQMARLEQQVANLQAMVAALESLVKAQPSAVLPQESAASGGQGFDAAAGVTARVDALETKVGALSSQLELLTQQFGALEARIGGGAVPERLTPPPQQDDQPLEPLPELPGRQGSADPADPAGTLVAGAGGLTSFQSSGQAAAPMSPPPAGEPQRLAALPTGVDAASLYSQGYGQLLQRDYAGAEASFRALLERFPGDPLAGKAEYWLGESYYARGAFKDAADAFLASYRTYGSGDKAPDSLLKLGMALAELGQKDAACSTFAEFGAKYPSAEPALLDQAKAERRKVGC